MNERWFYTLKLKRRWKPWNTIYRNQKICGTCGESKKKAIEYTANAVTALYGDAGQERCLDGWQTLRWAVYRISRYKTPRGLIRAEIRIVPANNPKNNLLIGLQNMRKS